MRWIGEYRFRYSRTQKSDGRSPAFPGYCRKVYASLMLLKQLSFREVTNGMDP
jgi:hypothetical protein